MADISSLLQPRVQDRDGLSEFIEDLADLVPAIERDIARLKRTPDDNALIADLFRALHNIKGDASICKVDVGVMIAHPIETLLEFANRRGITQLFIGHTQRSGLWSRLWGSPVDKLIRSSEGMDIRVFPQ